MSPPLPDRSSSMPGACDASVPRLCETSSPTLPSQSPRPYHVPPPSTSLNSGPPSSMCPVLSSSPEVTLPSYPVFPQIADASPASSSAEAPALRPQEFHHPSLQPSRKAKPHLHLSRPSASLPNLSGCCSFSLESSPPSTESPRIPLSAQQPAPTFALREPPQLPAVSKQLRPTPDLFEPVHPRDGATFHKGTEGRVNGAIRSQRKPSEVNTSVPNGGSSGHLYGAPDTVDYLSISVAGASERQEEDDADQQRFRCGSDLDAEDYCRDIRIERQSGSYSGVDDGLMYAGALFDPCNNTGTNFITLETVERLGIPLSRRKRSPWSRLGAKLLPRCFGITYNSTLENVDRSHIRAGLGEVNIRWSGVNEDRKWKAIFFRPKFHDTTHVVMKTLIADVVFCVDDINRLGLRERYCAAAGRKVYKPPEPDISESLA